MARPLRAALLVQAGLLVQRDRLDPVGLGRPSVPVPPPALPALLVQRDRLDPAGLGRPSVPVPPPALPARVDLRVPRGLMDRLDLVGPVFPEPRAGPWSQDLERPIGSDL